MGCACVCVVCVGGVSAVRKDPISTAHKLGKFSPTSHSGWLATSTTWPSSSPPSRTHTQNTIVIVSTMTVSVCVFVYVCECICVSC